MSPSSVNMQDTVLGLIRLGARREEAEAFALVACALPSELQQCTVQQIADMFRNGLSDELNSEAGSTRTTRASPTPTPTPTVRDDSSLTESDAENDGVNPSFQAPQSHTPDSFTHLVHQDSPTANNSARRIRLPPISQLSEITDFDFTESNISPMLPAYDSASDMSPPPISNDGLSFSVGPAVPNSSNPIQRRPRMSSFECANEAGVRPSRGPDPPAGCPPFVAVTPSSSATSIGSSSEDHWLKCQPRHNETNKQSKLRSIQEEPLIIQREMFEEKRVNDQRLNVQRRRANGASVFASSGLQNPCHRPSDHSNVKTSSDLYMTSPDRLKDLPPIREASNGPKATSDVFLDHVARPMNSRDNAVKPSPVTNLRSILNISNRPVSDVESIGSQDAASSVISAGDAGTFGSVQPGSVQPGSVQPSSVQPVAASHSDDNSSIRSINECDDDNTTLENRNSASVSSGSIARKTPETEDSSTSKGQSSKAASPESFVVVDRVPEYECLPRLESPFESPIDTQSEPLLNALRVEDSQTTRPLRRVDAEPIHPQPSFDSSINVLSLFSQSILSQGSSPQSRVTQLGSPVPYKPAETPCPAYNEARGTDPPRDSQSQADISQQQPPLAITLTQSVFVLPPYRPFSLSDPMPSTLSEFAASRRPQATAQREYTVQQNNPSLHNAFNVLPSLRSMTRNFTAQSSGNGQTSGATNTVQAHRSPREGASQTDSMETDNMQSSSIPPGTILLNSLRNNGTHPIIIAQLASMQSHFITTQTGPLLPNITQFLNFRRGRNPKLSNTSGPRGLNIASSFPHLCPLCSIASLSAQLVPPLSDSAVDELISNLWRKLVIQVIFSQLRIQGRRRRPKRELARRHRRLQRVHILDFRHLETHDEGAPYSPLHLVQIDRPIVQNTHGQTVYHITLPYAQMAQMSADELSAASETIGSDDEIQLIGASPYDDDPDSPFLAPSRVVTSNRHHRLYIHPHLQVIDASRRRGRLYLAYRIRQNRRRPQWRR